MPKVVEFQKKIFPSFYLFAFSSPNMILGFSSLKGNVEYNRGSLFVFITPKF